MPRHDDPALRLTQWLKDHGWSLKMSWSDDDHADFSSKQVVISRRRTSQSQVFGMLHEIGHIILSETADYQTRFPESYEFKRRQERPRETLRVRMSVLGEEWEAWALGESLAREMGLQIDYVAMRDSRNLDLKTYMSWNSNGL